VTKTGRTASARVIVTADDFGLSPKVDAGILEAFERGVVRSTALLVNFPDVKDSIARLREAPELEVGVHLNLTAGPPVLPSERVPSLVKADGNFHEFSAFFARVVLRWINWDEVYREWAAQIERGVGLGCQFSFLTSHQHVHMLPEAARIFGKLAQKYGVGAARISCFRLGDMLRPLRLKGLALDFFAPSVRKIFQNQALFCNDSIFEISPGKPDAALLRLCGIVNGLGEGVHELVCHPGYVDSMLRDRDSYVAERPTELAVLTDARLSACLQSEDIELTTFRALEISRLGQVKSMGNPSR
jgi:chitin disaccharide deacetylase